MDKVKKSRIIWVLAFMVVLAVFWALFHYLPAEYDNILQLSYGVVFIIFMFLIIKPKKK